MTRRDPPIAGPESRPGPDAPADSAITSVDDGQPEEFSPWFLRISGHAPHAWQTALGNEGRCSDRLLRIPTGFGKTAGVVLTWLYHRVSGRDDAWPRRLVFCLPMRALVEQTERAISGWLNAAGLHNEVRLHVLMGGVAAERWTLDIDKPAILVGTQDMLLSRALNRGYASGRGMWPMEFGSLHQDVLWTLDEVQLMDVGLATSGQLSAFRDQDSAREHGRLRPAHTWWMSATLQPRWLQSVDRPEPIASKLSIPAEHRKGGLFDVQKRLVRSEHIQGADAIAACAREHHVPGQVSLVVVNRVTTAIDVYDALVNAFSEGKGKKRERRADAPEVELVHSRFRGFERAKWAERFLRRDAPKPAAGRIIVATQVVEAGVDISARTLVTELAPWSSLVQRFGRTARYEGETGTAIVAGAVPTDDKSSAPYLRTQLLAAEEGVRRLLMREADASPRSLEAFEEEIAKAEPQLLERLYPYEPLHVLRRRDLDDLFDTSADLSGADLDVSRFIRSGEERDVTVFWRVFTPEKAVSLSRPVRRDELCPVPIGDIRAWKGRTYVLDYLDGVWTDRRGRLVPGMTVLLDASEGGYTPERGWALKSIAVDPVPEVIEEVNALAATSSTEGAEDLSAAPWKTIATHGREAEECANALCRALKLDDELSRVIVLAARWHDVGKVHEVFQAAIRSENRGSVPIGARRDLAKAPTGAWRRPPYPERPGFRHELASTLALFELLRRTEPLHPALLGRHRELFESIGRPIDRTDVMEHPLAREVAGLSAESFDLMAWLVCTHHGKVRCVWTSTPHDQEKGHGGIHGVCDGDALPGFVLTNSKGDILEVPSLTLSLSAAGMGVGDRYGASWGERVAGLRARHGPFTLAFLEAVLRVADWRASMLSTKDPRG
jgi:CRISPR-associated endonuclease/helicase Cas3